MCYEWCFNLRKMSQVVLFVIFVFVWLGFCLTCPSICSCKWKHGKETAECDGKGLSVIPMDLNAGTQVLDVSRNNFNEISSKAFQKKGLVNLQKIYMSECGITKISLDAFFQLSNLVEVDLSRNQLQSVPSNALSLCTNLRRLQLAHNPITTIERDAFSSLSHLTYLGLSNCQIKHVQPGALNGLQKLDNIELDGNRMNTLSIDIFQSVSYLFGLHLHNNPWHCDCKVREIRSWMIDHNIPFSVPPHCESPTYLKGLTWDVLSLEDFACMPKMLNVPKEMKVIAGQNASIHCQVNSTPKSWIYWEVSGRSLKNISSSTELKLKYNVESEESLFRHSSVLTILNAVDSDSDIYSCVAENKAGISSTNFTLTVLCLNHLTSSWNNSQITLLLFGILSVILLSAAVICLLVYHPFSLSFSSKMNRNMSSNKKDTVEMSDVQEDMKVRDKQPRYETGLDQLTPDLVSKIPDINNGPSLSLSNLSCNHLDSDAPVLLDGYWSHAKTKVIRSNVYSEIYLNPCYGKDDDVYNYALQSAGVDQLPDCAVADRYPPQNDLKCDSNRNESFISPGHPLVFSPDEGLEVTEV